MVEGHDISVFLEGHEVAFTTGIALKDEHELFELVVDNHKHHAAGMVINVGPYIKEIPEEVIRYADEHDFPVFRVPWRVHMSNIMRDFIAAIHMDSLSQMEAEVAFKDVFFNMDNAEHAKEVLQRNGFRKAWRYTVARIRLTDEVRQQFGEERCRACEHYVSDYLKFWNKNAFVMQIDHVLILVFYHQSEEEVRQSLEQLLEVLPQYFGEFRGYIGVGHTANGLNELSLSYHQAQQAVKLQKKRRLENQIASYEDLGLYKLIFALEGNAILETIRGDMLGELEQYDAIKGTDYLPFLRKYFEMDGSMVQMADELHMHRNSIIYKLKKIEEILNVSMNNKMDITRLMIALMIDDIK